jgi:hypothetical protein
MQTPLTTDPATIVAEAEAIIEWFYTDPAGDGGRDFGCDWPTMRILYPDHCARFDALKAEAVMNKGYKPRLLRRA